MLSWRDGRARKYTVSVFDLGPVGFGNPTSGPPVGPPTVKTLTVDERNNQSAAREFREFFPIAAPPQDNHRYRLEVVLETGAGQMLGTQTIDLVFRR
jgi:hypothetical protein